MNRMFLNPVLIVFVFVWQGGRIVVLEEAQIQGAKNMQSLASELGEAAFLKPDNSAVGGACESKHHTSLPLCDRH